MDNTPQYQIHGIERRKLKKELSHLKSFIKHFWYNHQLEKDMSCCMMSDCEAEIIYNLSIQIIKEIEKNLKKKWKK